MKNYIQTHKKLLLFLSGLTVFTGLNIFSASTMGLHYDEAYYWLFSKHPAFGYFDHPPMVAWLIWAGTIIINNELGIRLLSIVISSISMVVLWLLLNPKKDKPLLFWALTFSIIIIHPYSFIATPDAPLLFFTVLFLYVFKMFIEKPQIGNSLFLALVSAAMLYSKYHAILIIGPAVLINPKLLKLKNFWLYIFALTALMIPHLLWQYNNNFPSIYYHLIDSHKTGYNPLITLEYIASQFLVFGPFSAWLLFAFAYAYRPANCFGKTAKWSTWFILLFFLFSTIGGDYEAHWTLIATPSLMYIAFEMLQTKFKWKKFIVIAGSINFVLLLIVRLLVITPAAEKIRALSLFSGWDIDTQILLEASNNHPIVFQDCWNHAARFAWYAQKPNITTLNSGMHRNNQFDIWDKDEQLNGQTVVLAARNSLHLENTQAIITNKGTWHIKTIEKFKSYYNLQFKIIDYSINNGIQAKFSIYNPYHQTVVLNKNEAKLQLVIRKQKWELLAEIPLEVICIDSKKEITIYATIDYTDSIKEETYLMLKIGKLHPLPTKYLIEPK